MFARPIRKAEYGQALPVTIEDMLTEIRTQSNTIGAVMDKVQPQLEALDSAALAAISHIYITGCGDSFFAGLAARLAFEQYAGVPTEPAEALEFGRYTAEFILPQSLVLGISNSGKATRAVEALANGRRAGAHTIAITGNSNGWLAQEAHTILNQSAQSNGRALTMPSNLDSSAPRRGAFGLANYLASLTTLYMTALHLGQVRGRLTTNQADALRAELRGLAQVLDETVTLCTPAAQAYAATVKDVYHFAILGAGPSYATSLFYAAKTFELARVNGVSQELEEWAHEQFFLTGPGTQMLFIAPPGRSTSRVLELLETARTMGATRAVVTDAAGTAVRAQADVLLPVAGQTREVFSPMVYCVPGELFATYLAQARGRQAFEFDSETQYVMNMVTIQESQIFEFGEQRGV